MTFNFIMKKEYRIRKNEEFASIISKKHSKSSACFVIYFETKALDHPRVGISVSKKMGDAVERNKIKRQIREMAYELVDFENGLIDIVIIVKKAYLDRSFLENKLDLEKLIKKAII